MVEHCNENAYEEEVFLDLTQGQNLSNIQDNTEQRGLFEN